MTDNRDNPWLQISAADYEGHMGSPQVGQLKFLSSTFRDFLLKFQPKRLAVIGCSTGNGFEHINTEQVERVIGIDIQPDYLNLLRKRFSSQLPQLELICKDVCEVELQSSSLDFIFAGLLFEYVDPELTLRCFAQWLAPKGILATVLQLPCEDISFAESSYMSIQKLEAISQLIDPGRLTEMARSCGLHLTDSKVETLPSGKQFFIGCYRKSD